jgi:RNA polymerase-binding transcription factor DksA
VSEEQAARVSHELDRATAHAANVQAEYDELMADPGVIQEDRDAAALLLEHARRRLDSAMSAVAQLDAGAYGRCARCGGDIGQERLAALVDVTTCVSCAG